MDEKYTVCVTGATGYVASWIIKFFLEKGHTVHGTVRNLAKKERYQHLVDIADNSDGKLVLFEADLLKEASFDEAVNNCEFLLHTASPFFIQNIKDAKSQLIEPALKGTKNVLESFNKNPKAKRVVLTSSVAAIYGDNIDIKAIKNGKFDESHWNTSSSIEQQAYSYSKTLAEKAAWEMEKTQNNWVLNVMNPGFVFGPSLTDFSTSTSISFSRELLSGRYAFGTPNIYTSIVDVRDVAEAHYKACFSDYSGERHILVSEVMSFRDVASTFKKHSKTKLWLSDKALPKWLLLIIAPLLGVSNTFFKNNLDTKIAFDNSFATKRLGINFKPAEETLKDMLDWLRNY